MHTSPIMCLFRHYLICSSLVQILQSTISIHSAEVLGQNSQALLYMHVLIAESYQHRVGHLPRAMHAFALCQNYLKSGPC